MTITNKCCQRIISSSLKHYEEAESEADGSKPFFCSFAIRALDQVDIWAHPSVDTLPVSRHDYSQRSLSFLFHHVLPVGDSRQRLRAKGLSGDQTIRRIIIDNLPHRCSRPSGLDCRVVLLPRLECLAQRDLRATRGSQQAVAEHAQEAVSSTLWRV